MIRHKKGPMAVKEPEAHKSGEHSHKHHHAEAKHHHKMMKHHMDELAKMAKHSHHGKKEHHHVTAHDRAVDRKNLAKARNAR